MLNNKRTCNSHSYLCPLCGQQQRFSPFRFSLLKCSKCGVVVDKKIWNIGTAEQMVDDWFSDAASMKPDAWTRYYEACNNKRTYKKLGLLNTGSRILDVGIGSGSLLVFLQIKGFFVEGCDLSKHKCDYISQKYGIKTYASALEAIAETEKFDVIIMNHVLEHTENPVQMLASAFKLLKQGGKILVGVPNINAAGALLPGWVSYQPYHLSYFSKKTISRVFLKTGFEIISIETRESFSGWFLAIVRTLLKSKSTQTNAVLQKAQDGIKSNKISLSGHAVRAITTVAGMLIWPLRYLQGKLGLGDEIIVTANKLFTAETQSTQRNS
jgi:2-polyprenyl-3-methyl-5-hydroxy-6-metoxy-1,4-benzoquinol methylase